MKEFNKSSKLEHVAYDIRGPVLEEAMRMRANGEKILRLNTGNPAEFGFTADRADDASDSQMNVGSEQIKRDLSYIYSGHTHTAGYNAVLCAGRASTLYVAEDDDTHVELWVFLLDTLRYLHCASRTLTL